MKKDRLPKKTEEQIADEGCMIVAKQTKRLMMAFLKEGFTTDQAFDLTKLYIAEGVIDNI